MDLKEFEKFILNGRPDEDSEEFWDQKSGWFYNRTEKNAADFSKEFVFTLIKERNLLTAQLTVLDIGCGTGRHLYEFSRFTHNLTGTDISSKILSYAKERLKHIPEAKLVHGNWIELFSREKEFDLVFASMTPAIASIESLKRMSFISKKYCMLERFIYRKNSVQEEIEKMCGKTVFRSHHNNKDYVYGVWNILWNLDYLPEVFFDKRIQLAEHTIEEIMEDSECSGTEKDKIVQFLKTKEKNGKIESTEIIVKTVILWEREKI